jgi:hypothetical protein
MHRNNKAQGTTITTKYKNSKSTIVQRNMSEHMNNETHKSTRTMKHNGVAK